MMICGLSQGLAMDDMRKMRMCDVANIVNEASAMRREAAKDDESEVRDATDEDIEWLKSLGR